MNVISRFYLLVNLGITGLFFCESDLIRWAALGCTAKLGFVFVYWSKMGFTFFFNKPWIGSVFVCVWSKVVLSVYLQARDYWPPDIMSYGHSSRYHMQTELFPPCVFSLQALLHLLLIACQWMRSIVSFNQDYTLNLCVYASYCYYFHGKLKKWLTFDKTWIRDCKFIYTSRYLAW